MVKRRWMYRGSSISSSALRMWGRLHGLVSLEILGHLRTLTTDPDKLYHSEVDEMIRGLGL